MCWRSSTRAAPTLNSQPPADLAALDAFFSAQQQPCVITIQRKGKTLDINLPAP